MFKKYWIYYAKGVYSHESIDDVAIIKARTRKEALNILKKYVKLDNLEYDLYRIKIPMTKYHSKEILRVSEY